MAEIMLLGFITVRKIRNCGMFMVNNIGFTCKKAAKVKKLVAGIYWQWLLEGFSWI